MTNESGTPSEEQSKAERAASVARALNDEAPPVTEAPNPDGGSDPATGASDVGESIGRRGEDMVDDDGKEAGRTDTGTESPTGRPSGTSSIRDGAGIAPRRWRGFVEFASPTSCGSRRRPVSKRCCPGGR